MIFQIYKFNPRNVSSLFADDTTLTFKGLELNLLTVISNNKLKKCKAWSDSNHLTANVEKNNCLLVTNLANTVHPSIVYY